MEISVELAVEFTRSLPYRLQVSVVLTDAYSGDVTGIA